MQEILDKLKDILSRKGAVKTVVTVLALAGFGVYAYASQQKPAGHKIVDNKVVSSEKEDEGKVDVSEIEIEPTEPDVPVVDEPVPEATDSQTIDVSDETRYINPCTKALGMWIEEDGRMTNLTQDPSDWYIIDCSSLVSVDPKYDGLYEMRTNCNNIDPVYNEDGKVRYVAYDVLYLDCFATDNGDGTATIHYLGSSLGILIDDGFVTDEMKATTIGM